MKEVLDKHPEIKLLENKTANWSRQEAFKVMQDWLVAHPGEIKGVLAQNDEMALGAIRALKAADIDPKTVPVAGVDGVTDATRRSPREKWFSRSRRIRTRKRRGRSTSRFVSWWGRPTSRSPTFGSSIRTRCHGAMVQPNCTTALGLKSL